jgi:hypothetical protein
VDRTFWIVALASLQIFLGFYLMRYGALAGLIERRIRTYRYSREAVTGRTAVGWGIFYVLLGMTLMVVAAYLLVAAFR